MTTHSSILARRIPWTEEPWNHRESDTTEATRILYIQSKSCYLFTSILQFQICQGLNSVAFLCLSILQFLYSISHWAYQILKHFFSNSLAPKSFPHCSSFHCSLNIDCLISRGASFQSPSFFSLETESLSVLSALFVQIMPDISSSYLLAVAPQSQLPALLGSPQDALLTSNQMHHFLFLPKFSFHFLILKETILLITKALLPILISLTFFNLTLEASPTFIGC